MADAIHLPDAFYPGIVWTVVEPAVGVISGCLPVLQPAILHFLPKSFRLSTPAAAKAFDSNKAHSWFARGRDGRRTSNTSERPFARFDRDGIPLATLHPHSLLERMVARDLESKEQSHDGLDVERAHPAGNRVGTVVQTAREFS